jgi:hypothetical protein
MDEVYYDTNKPGIVIPDETFLSRSYPLDVCQHDFCVVLTSGQSLKCHNIVYTQEMGTSTSRTDADLN